MKACVLHAINDLRYEEVEKPIPKPGEVLVKIKASGICGSDIPRVFTKGTYNFPTIPGHEFGGIIEEAEKKALIGKKCTVFPLLPCRKCDMCDLGNYAQCENYNYFGSRCDGGFAEYIAVPEWNIVIAPDELSYEEIAMCEPAAVALHSLERANVRAGDSLAVFGAGPIGIMIGKWAQIKGISDIYLIDIDPKKVEFAESLGFKTELSEQVDISIEGAGVSQTLEQAAIWTKPFGTVVCMGNPAEKMELSQKGYWNILRKELMLKGTWNSGYKSSENDWKTVLKSLNKLDIGCLVSHRYSLSECNEAFNLVNDRKVYFNKVMFMV